MKKTIAFVAVVASASLTNAATINVPLDYAAIQAGIDVAIDGDTVLVAPGTYLESINFNNRLGSRGRPY